MKKVIRWSCVAGMVVGVQFSAGFALGTPPCDELRAFEAAGAPTGGVMTPEVAAHWAVRLLAAVDAAPDGECAFSLRTAAIVSLTQAGDARGAAEVAGAGLAHETDPIRRALLANNFIGLRTRGMAHPDHAARVECRAAALAGLEGVPALDDLLEADRFEDIATVMPLHRVVASTMPAGERAAALESLLARCEAINEAGRTRILREPVRFDQNGLVRELLEVRLGESNLQPAAVLALIERALDRDGQPTRSRLLAQTVRDERVPRAVREALVTDAPESYCPPGQRASLSYTLTLEAYRQTRHSTDQAELAAVDDLAGRTWALIRHAEEVAGGPGALPEGVDSASQWEGVVSSLLTTRWMLTRTRLDRPEVAEETAREHVRRFPQRNPSSAMALRLER